MSVLIRNTTRPQQALQSYLDDLLQDALVDLEAQELADFENAVREEQALDARRTAKPVLPAVATAPEPLPVVALQPVPVTPVAAVTAETEQRPAWADEPFECLLFDVAGLTLAVPLVCLGSIYPMDSAELTPLFGQPDWFLGLLPTQSGNLRVLDTARWVLAERYRDDLREGLQYAISVQGFEWGLAVHQVSRSIRLDPQAVKWRSRRSQRPWLAGTVIEHMCALLDVTALAELIVAGDANRQAPGSS